MRRLQTTDSFHKVSTPLAGQETGKEKRFDYLLIYLPPYFEVVPGLGSVVSCGVREGGTEKERREERGGVTSHFL